MGLDVRIHKYNDNPYGIAFSCCYSTFGWMKRKIVLAAYGAEMSELYEKYCHPLYWEKNFTEEERQFWNAHCNDDLDLLIWHSDCDGKFTPKECRKIYEAIKDLHVDLGYFDKRNGVVVKVNMLEEWKNMFLFCARRRVNMYFM